MDKTTVLYLDHTAKMGGGEIAILNLIRALDKEQYHPIVLLGSDGALVREFEESEIETHVIKLDPDVLDTRKDTIDFSTMFRLGKLVRVFRYAKTLADWTRGRNIDIIHTNSLKSDIYGGLAGLMAKIPVIWHVRDNINFEYLPKFAATVFRFLARIIPDVVVTNSESTLRTLNMPKSDPTAVVYSGVAKIPDPVPIPSSSSFAHKPNEPSGNAMGSSTFDWPKRPIIALIGRIAEWKGQHVFIRAAMNVLSKYPNARFWIVGSPLFGEDAYEASLRSMVAEMHIQDSVEFLGFRDDVQVLLNDISIVVHTSIIGEPFGQVVIEGMAAGKPVIATNGGALPEIIIPDKTGILVPMGDATALTDSIIWMLAHPEEAHAMALAGRERVRSHFTIEHTVAKVQVVYQNLMDRNRQRRGATAVAISDGVSRSRTEEKSQ